MVSEHVEALRQLIGDLDHGLDVRLRGQLPDQGRRRRRRRRGPRRRAVLLLPVPLERRGGFDVAVCSESEADRDGVPALEVVLEAEAMVSPLLGFDGERSFVRGHKQNRKKKRQAFFSEAAMSRDKKEKVKIRFKWRHE